MKSCCIFGLGYIGLPTAATLANSGFKVFGVDINDLVIDTINNGKTHIKEKNLNELVKNQVEEKNLIASREPNYADVFIIAVPTPFIYSKGNIPKPNIEYVLNAAKKLSKYIRPKNLVLLESTSPVGTTENIANLISKESGLDMTDFYVAYCPERVLPGNILNELISNDRVIGGISDKAALEGKKFYSNFCTGNLYTTNSRTAELVKLTENSFRDVNIAFANELSMISNFFDIDVEELIKFSNCHPRVNILQPGCGVGGHCIAVDPWFIASAVPNLSTLIQTSRKVNLKKTGWVFEQIKIKVRELEKKYKKEIKVGCLGMSFKPNIDDLRESPALEIIQKLIYENFSVMVSEPNLDFYNDIKLFKLEKIIEEVDLLVFLVAHDQFKNLNLEKKEYLDFCGIKNLNKTL